MTDIYNPGSADNQSEELFTVAEAAKKLKISIATLNRVRARKEIAFYLFGASRVLISSRYIQDYLRRREQNGGAA